MFSCATASGSGSNHWMLGNNAEPWWLMKIQHSAISGNGGCRTGNPAQSNRQIAGILVFNLPKDKSRTIRTAIASECAEQPIEFRSEMGARITKSCFSNVPFSGLGIDSITPLFCHDRLFEPMQLQKPDQDPLQQTPGAADLHLDHA